MKKRQEKCPIKKKCQTEKKEQKAKAKFNNRKCQNKWKCIRGKRNNIKHRRKKNENVR